MKKNLVWLASYPKSGNTWSRIFLANYLLDPPEPVSINEIHKFGFGDASTNMYRSVAGPLADLKSARASISFRTRVLRKIVNNDSDINFLKTHNANTAAFGVTIIPPDFTRCAVYFVRNPLDVVPSFSRHYGCAHAVSVEKMGRRDFVLGEDENTKQVTQFLGSWSDHVSSWTGQSPFPVLVLRYEDILADPEGSFLAMVRHVGLPVDMDRLKKAVEFSSFKVLQAQEKEGGFREKPEASNAFFASGKSGTGLTDMQGSLVDTIVRDHGSTMRKFGYLE